MEKVSIIVAIYKSEKFLPKLLESIINQTWKNLEILLMDDGSPDQSGRICDQYATKDSRINVVHRENGGACAARNDGLSRVTGDYVLVVDGDDWLENDYVEYLMNLIHSTGADMAMTDNIFTTRDRIQVDYDSIEVLTPEDAFCAIIYPKIPIGPWNKIYKTELLKKNQIDFSRPWSGEGLYFSAKAAQFSNFVALGHKKIYNYRLNNANSGLTHYNIQMGTNALENIKYIGDKQIIGTQRAKYAVDWHIWKNYGYVLFLIIATDSVETNIKLYKECIHNIRLRLFSVVFHSELSLKTKLKMLYQGVFPIFWAKNELKRQRLEFQADSME
ncbi:glycosyltransferase [Streptococcus suis]|nr:glycosyltransferase [Streptococcus suis]BCP58063.1 glycosyl transferase [Streptococcus parasuis]HEL1557986.1 glycosyltransferase [Streptococcus suis]